MIAELAHALGRTIVTARLTLEPITGAHAEALFVPMQAPAMYEWISVAPPTTVEALRARWSRIESRLSPTGDAASLGWAARRTADGVYVGKLDAEVNAAHVAENVGYLVFPAFWGRGYATEALAGVVARLEDHGVHELHALVTQGNEASERVLVRSGFTRVRVIPNNDEIRGVKVDDVAYLRRRGSLGNDIDQTPRVLSAISALCIDSEPCDRSPLMSKALGGQLVVLASLAVLVSACCRSSGPSGPGATKPTDTTTPKAATASPPSGGGTPEATGTPAKPPTLTPPAAGGRGPDGLPAVIPETRSKVPTLAEWDAVGEITVPLSTPLGCETKMVREWLRVSCKGKSTRGGKPGNVTKQNGCSGETLLFSKMEQTTSMVSPVLRGKSCEVRFTWTNDKAAWLNVDWPAGTPRPVIAFREQ